LPALAWTLGLQKRAARVGFDYTSPNAAAEAVAEEARELASASDAKQTFDEMGDLLFAMVSLARQLKVNPEDALRVAGERFRSRFAKAEGALREEGRTFRELDAEEMERRWAETK
jgi:tetrapyrrole methylase family protein/MazG family protein